jgi:hypothetical protein
MQQRLVRDCQGQEIGGRIVEEVVMFLPGRTEAMEGLSLAMPRTLMERWNEKYKRERYILDSLRVPVILNPALLDLINKSPSTSGFTLQSKIDILYCQPSGSQLSYNKHTR